MDYPKYNKLSKQYEITTKEELIAMSSDWCSKMPRDGNYVLMNDIDMSGCENFVPIGYKKERAFIGTFDGNYHCIQNITIKHEKKYVALFKYLGNNQNPNANIKNLYIKYCDIKGSQNVAGIAGVNYGIIQNCIVTGTIQGNSNTGSHTVGGIAGKTKEGGCVIDCMVNVNIHGSYDIGGISGIQEEGGIIKNCFVLGKLVANDENGMTGGVVGAINAGGGVINCVVALNSIQGEKYIGKIVGQFDDETGENVSNNIAWEGIKMLGCENISSNIKMDYVNADSIQNKDMYTKLGWDFSSIWEFNNSLQIPVLKGFSYDIKPSFKIDYPIIIMSNVVDRIKKGQDLKVDATVLSDIEPKVSIYYSDIGRPNKLTKKDMTKVANNHYTYTIKYIDCDKLHYYISVDGSNSHSIYVNVGDFGMQKKPSQITLTLGKNATQIGVNWVTDAKISDTILWYRQKKSLEWLIKKGTKSSPKEGALNSHKVIMPGLKPNTVYQYMVGDLNGNVSDIYEFKTASSNKFSFLFVADPQAVSTKDYQAFERCLRYATKQTSPDFIINAGDITQNGYKTSEWEACFEVLGDYFKRYPTISIPGNHEAKGDEYFTQYCGRFFMPSVNINTPYNGTIGAFEYKNAYIVTVNTEIMDDDALRNTQLTWLKDVFTKSKKKWKILLIHRGMYMVNHSSKKIREYFGDILEELGVSLVLSGHDHIYTRRNENGIIYITGGTVGNKFYEYINEEGLKIDVWRDKPGCQTYSVINIDGDSIEIEVYSKEDVDDWESFVLIDKVTMLS